jgi:hypothetical protein
VGCPDERGNTVKYIYAIDPEYVVYYSRLEHRDTEPETGKADAAGKWSHRLKGLASFLRRNSGSPRYEREGVQAQLSTNPVKRTGQRRKLLALGTERAKLQALLSGWPRRESYDLSIATALQLALDGDAKSDKNALDTLNDAKTSILSEREVAGRAQYVKCALAFGVVGFVLLGCAQHNMFHGSGNFWLGAQAARWCTDRPEVVSRPEVIDPRLCGGGRA